MAIITIYLAVNVAYLYVSPIGAVAQSPLIAADTMPALVGRIGASFVSVVVMMSTFGALMAVMLASPRVFFAMADDRLFFNDVARVHPRYGTPHVAIGIAGLLGVALRADADLRAAGRHVRAVDLAVLRPGHRRPVPAAPHPARTCCGRIAWSAIR